MKRSTAGCFSARYCLARWWFVALFALLLLPTATACAQTFDEWIVSQRDAATRKMLAALGRNGAVVASPDESTPDQNYYFHWVRDGALTMDVVVGRWSTATGSPPGSAIPTPHSAAPRWRP